ncbi:RNA-binding cell elongation regulator Jag/EloR [Salinibacillus xinjiangensis]|uniref:RNA-binding protein KhpB n=1 Tax=Salinibacillus xinjiangensis TaxID=1229268 RepID=A0A6G1XAE6_9BACI|nr:RNA-binding cell elongation regulator Jag/EloR [Salinibacillus xinjiangensis]MRG87954.1 KH domain-containing protein [Salinibacillus xinjiangensis]
MRQVTATGQTVEEAIQSALEKLETTKERVEVDIIDEGKKGVFGLFGSKPAIVKVSLLADKSKEGEEYLRQIAEKMGIEVDLNVIKNDKEIQYELSGDKIAMLIGKRGQTLNALQYLTQLVVNKNIDRYKTVIVDAEGYRGRRNDTLKQLADRLAQKAVRIQKEVLLEPMPSYERKVIHTALQNYQKVSTYSDGVEPNRRVVIKPE